MSKRLFLGIIALSALTLLRTQANASTCLSWRNVGGSNCCTRWSTASILAEVTFNQDCGGEGEGCTTGIFAQSSNNIAFCENPTNPTGPPIKTTCTETVTFSGPGNFCSEQPSSCQGQGQFCPKGKADCCAGLNCVNNSATDHTKVCRAFGTTGQPGESCTSTTELTAPGSCQSACDAANLGPVLDVVPVVMDTQLDLTAVVGGDCTPTPPTALFECPSCSSTCVIQQHCTIDPKKIAYQAIREYQCTVTSVSGGGGGG